MHLQVTMGSAGNPSCACDGDPTGFPGGGAVFIGADSATLQGKVIADGFTVGNSGMCGECLRVGCSFWDAHPHGINQTNHRGCPPRRCAGNNPLPTSGAGGSILVQARVLERSTGLLRANGGNGKPLGCGANQFSGCKHLVSHSV